MSNTSLKFIPADFSEQEWTSLVATSPDYNLLQTWAYAEAKVATGPWEVVRGVILDDGREVGAAQTVIRFAPVFRGGLAWLNRGPMALVNKNDRPTLVSGMIEAIKVHFVNEWGLYLRVAPSLHEEELSNEALKLTTMKRAGVLGWASAKLDLTSHETDLRKALNAKWRGHLSKAERAGLTVRRGSDDGHFQEFYQLYTQMLLEKNLSTNLSAVFFETLQKFLPNDRKMEVFIAMDGAKILGSTLIAKYGSCCEYLATTTTPEGRRKNAGQLQLWTAILEMRAQGYRSFDLSGVDPLQTPKGILTFKQGVGAIPYRLAPELETFGGGIVNRAVRWKVQRSRLQG